MRQQMIDQVGLVGAQLVPLAAAEEGARRLAVVVVRRIAVAMIVVRSVHRSVWNSRCNSRARGSIEDTYICS